jgi:hypothetical protein
MNWFTSPENTTEDEMWKAIINYLTNKEIYLSKIVTTVGTKIVVGTEAEFLFFLQSMLDICC